MLRNKIVESACPAVHVPDHLSLPHFIMMKFAEYGKKVAIVDGVTQQQYSFEDLSRLVPIVSASFTRHGVERGNVIGIFSVNHVNYAPILLAAPQCGAIISLINPTFTAAELNWQLSNCHAKFLICSQENSSIVLEARKLKGCPLLKTFVFGSAEGCVPFDSLTVGPPLSELVKCVPRQDLVLLPYSSGTTGLPKGVMLSHYNIICNVTQVNRAEKGGWEISTADTILGLLPFWHSYGLVILLCSGLAQGTTIVSLPKFLPLQFLQAIQKYRIRYLHLVPPIILFLAKDPMVANFDLSSVDSIYSAAAPLGKDIAEATIKRLGIKSLRQGYGLTETGPATNLARRATWKHGSIGPPLPMTLCKVVDINTDKDLGPGEDGEICMKGPQIMKGYFENEKATAGAFDSDGWFHSGDIGHYDSDGQFYIIDRIKELIKWKGEQVAPAELEGLILTHPKVQDVAVVGVPDASAGELPKAYIVPRDSVSAEDVVDFVKRKVAPHKRLRGGVEFVKEIPKSASGKILRRILKEAERKKALQAKL